MYKKACFNNTQNKSDREAKHVQLVQAKENCVSIFANIRLVNNFNLLHVGRQQQKCCII